MALLLQDLLTLPTDEIDEHVSYFNNSFDAKKAKKDGKIVPVHGVNERYDSASASHLLSSHTSTLLFPSLVLHVCSLLFIS